MCVTVRRALFEFDTLKYCRKEKDALARRMDDVKRKVSRISYVKYLTLLTSKDDVWWLLRTALRTTLIV